MALSTYDVLLRLVRARDGLRMSELAKRVFMTTGGLTRMADRLERDGLITRSRSANDLRGYEARITPTGRKAFDRPGAGRRTSPRLHRRCSRGSPAGRFRAAGLDDACAVGEW